MQLQESRHAYLGYEVDRIDEYPLILGLRLPTYPG